MAFITKRTVEHNLSSRKKKYNHYFIEKGYRDDKKNYPQTEYIARLGAKPEPQELLREIKRNDLMDQKEKLVEDFYNKVEHIKKEFDSLEEFKKDFKEEVPYRRLEHRKLENFILEHFESCFPSLEKFETSQGCSEIQLGDAGTMDILAKRKSNGNLIVMELKTPKAGKDTVGQISAYITGVKDNFAGKNQEVEAMIIAEEFNNDIIPSLENFEVDVHFKSYEMSFSVKDIKL